MIAEDLPPHIALLEHRLNLEHQYSPTLAYLVVDMAIQQVVMEVTMESMKNLILCIDGKKTKGMSSMGMKAEDYLEKKE